MIKGLPKRYSAETIRYEFHLVRILFDTLLILPVSQVFNESHAILLSISCKGFLACEVAGIIAPNRPFKSVENLFERIFDFKSNVVEHLRGFYRGMLIRNFLYSRNLIPLSSRICFCVILFRSSKF